MGAVVVRGGSVLAEASHEEFGAPHAEVLALAAAGDVRGSTVYASLEPCAHTGKTPPCTDALAAAGVARVVYWAPEPGSRAGGGGARLRAAGVQTDGPFGSPAEWAGENPFFYHRRPRPFVALKLAVSADARIAPPNGRRAWITESAARREAHRLRAGFDAILVGTGTWKADDPRLTVRGPVTPRVPPARVLLDRSGQVSRAARAFDPPGGPALVAAGPGRAAALRSRLGSRAEVVSVPAPARLLDMAALLQALDDRGYARVLCEGGGRLGACLLAAGHVDRLYLFLAPKTVGRDGVPALPATAPFRLPSASGLPEYVEAIAARTGADAHPPPRGWRIAQAPACFGPDALVVLDRED